MKQFTWGLRWCAFHRRGPLILHFFFLDKVQVSINDSLLTQKVIVDYSWFPVSFNQWWLIHPTKAKEKGNSETTCCCYRPMPWLVTTGGIPLAEKPWIHSSSWWRLSWLTGRISVDGLDVKGPPKAMKTPSESMRYFFFTWISPQIFCLFFVSGCSLKAKKNELNLWLDPVEQTLCSRTIGKTWWSSSLVIARRWRAWTFAIWKPLVGGNEKRTHAGLSEKN